MKPIHKFNNGRGAMLCNTCRTIISTGPATKELYCDKCKPKQELERGITINHKGKELTTEEVIESRSSAYEFIDFDKKETLEENCCTPIGQIKRYVDCISCDRKPKQKTKWKM